MAQALGMGIFSPESVAEVTEAQRGVPCHTARWSLQNPNSCPRAQRPTRLPTHPPAWPPMLAVGGEELNLPQHPEISTKSQTTRQLVVMWYLMVPGDTKKKVRRSLLLVGALLFKALQHLPTLVAPGSRAERESTQMGGGRGAGTWERRRVCIIDITINQS